MLFCTLRKDKITNLPEMFSLRMRLTNIFSIDPQDIRWVAGSVANNREDAVVGPQKWTEIMGEHLQT